MSNHRAVKGDVRRRSTSSGDTGQSLSTPGKRRATRASRSSAPRALTPASGIQSFSSHIGGRKKLIPGLPSAPAVAGFAALALAAAGAVTASQTGADSQLASGSLQRLSAQANVLNGASGISSNSAVTVRERSLSRDSQREALEDAADEELVEAAEAQAKERNAALLALAHSAEKFAGVIARNGWELPITSGVYHLTATFGESSGLWSHTHTGLDFAAPSGTAIQAVASGVVTDVGYEGAYGNRTVVTLEDGTEIWYCHQTAYAVSVGDNVTAGQTIGSVGSTGNTTGPHLHLEVRPGAGDPVDPYNALVAHGINP